MSECTIHTDCERFICGGLERTLSDLRAQLAKLGDEAQKTIAEKDREIDLLDKQLAQAQARERRLQEAPEKIADGRWNHERTKDIDVHRFARFARAALAEPERKNG